MLKIHVRFSKFQKFVWRLRFSKYVRYLIIGRYLFYGDCAVRYIATEVTIRDVYVFGSRSYLCEVCYFDRFGVVLEGLEFYLSAH